MPAEALFYDLYLPTLGGGERFLLAMADVVATERPVSIGAPKVPPAAQMERLGVGTHLPCRRIHPAAFVAASARRELVVYLANGVPLPSFADRSIAVVQFPMRSLGGRWVGRRLQRAILDGYELVVYSTYVQQWIERRWDRTAAVVHPPVPVGTFDPTAKEPFILAVGRFFAVQHSKRQDVLVEAFRRLAPGVPGWRLVLAGSVSAAPGSQAYVDRLRARAEGLPVDFVLDAPQPVLTDLFRRAALFWHAAGFERPPDAPEQAEHFGISTVEAMGHGAVPLAYDDGGQSEILAQGGGVLWSDLAELVEETRALTNDAGRRESLAREAANLARRYDLDSFRSGISRVLSRSGGAGDGPSQPPSPGRRSG